MVLLDLIPGAHTHAHARIQRPLFDFYCICNLYSRPALFGDPHYLHYTSVCVIKHIYEYN